MMKFERRGFDRLGPNLGGGVGAKEKKPSALSLQKGGSAIGPG